MHTCENAWNTWQLWTILLLDTNNHYLSHFPPIFCTFHNAPIAVCSRSSLVQKNKFGATCLDAQLCVQSKRIIPHIISPRSTIVVMIFADTCSLLFLLLKSDIRYFPLSVKIRNRPLGAQDPDLSLPCRHHIVIPRYGFVQPVVSLPVALQDLTFIP